MAGRKEGARGTRLEGHVSIMEQHHSTRPGDAWGEPSPPGKIAAAATGPKKRAAKLVEPIHTYNTDESHQDKGEQRSTWSEETMKFRHIVHVADDHCTGCSCAGERAVTLTDRHSLIQ